METETTKKRQRDSSNIIKWHYTTKYQTGEPVGLRGYSHYDETERYEILPDEGGWKLFFCWWSNLTGTPGLDEPHCRRIKTGTLFECMEAAELHDEKIGESLSEAEEPEWE